MRTSLAIKHMYITVRKDIAQVVKGSPVSQSDLENDPCDALKQGSQPH